MQCTADHEGFRRFRDGMVASIGGGADEVTLQILARLDGFTA